MAIPGKSIFRVNDWWQSKAALLMGMVYLFAAWFNIPLKSLLPLACFSLITIAGFASFGYLINDLFDIDQDRLVGKRNFMAGKSVWAIAGLVCISMALVYGPWFYLPYTVISFGLIVTQLLLFILYSMPPIRLKERGMAGIITDALYAHSLPPILAAYTFSLAAGVPLPAWHLLLLFGWQTVSGIRNILLHQLDDREADKKSGVVSYIAPMTTARLHLALTRLIISEIILGTLFFILLGNVKPLFVIPLATVIALSLTALFIFRRLGIRGLLHTQWRFFPNNVYEKWLPIAYLAVLSFSDTRFVIIAIIHVAIFNYDFYTQSAAKLYQFTWPPLKTALAYIRKYIATAVNYIIYYALRLVGVDLRKENTDAAGYFKRKRKKK